MSTAMPLEGDLVFMKRCKYCGHALLSAESRNSEAGPKCRAKAKRSKRNGPNHSTKNHAGTAKTNSQKGR